MKNHRGIVYIAILLSLSQIICGFGSNIPKLDLKTRPVYKRCEISEITRNIDSKYEETNDRYNNIPIVTNGTVESIDNAQKSLVVKIKSNQVNVSIKQKNDVEKLQLGDTVTIFGRLDIGSKKRKTVSIKADHITKDIKSLTDDYYIYGGKSYSDSKSSKVDINNFSFRIPKTWTGTEVDENSYKKIFNSEIGKDKTGKCYYINTVNNESEPEVFAVFYFNNNIFLEKNSNGSKTHSIEKAIINNICPKEKFKFYDVTKWMFPAATSQTTDGLEIDHYVGDYDNYRVEFAFTTVKDGLCVMIHLYNDDSVNVDDILYVLNSLSIRE